MDTQRILIDTSIAVEGGEAIIAKLGKIAPVFVTDIVLQELDGHKNNANGAVAFQAREFFRRLGNSNGIALDVLPLDGMKLEKTDTLRKMFLGATPLHVIVRKPYKSRDINDSKIIEIAKDYNMTLVTLDMAQKVRAMSEGVNVETLKVAQEEETKNQYKTALMVLSPFYVLSFFSPLFLGFLGIKFSPSNIGLVLSYFALLVSMTALMNFLYAKMKKQSLADFLKEEKGINSEASNDFRKISDYTTDPIYSSHYGNINHGASDLKLS